MGIFGEEHPYSAVTQWIDRLTSEQYAEDDIDGLPELCETINLQTTGPREASRALRKKLKYGNTHRQLRSLTILKALVDNCGTRFQRTFANERLMERLKSMATDPLVDKDVHRKLMNLLATWAHQFKDDNKMYAVAHLYAAVGGGKKRVQPPPIKPQPTGNTIASPTSPTRSTPVAELIPVSSPPPAPAASSSSTHARTSSKDIKKKESKDKDKKKLKVKPFDWQKEKPQVVQEIAIANQNANNLINGLKLINREVDNVADNEKIKENLAKCNTSRKSIVKYTRLVEDEEWIGTLVQTNDNLLYALQMYEKYLKPIDQDSEDEEAEDDQELQRIREILSRVNMDDPAPALPTRRPSEPAAPPPAMPARPQLDLDALTGAFAVPAGDGKLASPVLQQPNTNGGLLHPNQAKGKAVADGEEDPFADPFADPNTPIQTPALEKGRMEWAEV